MLRHQYDEILRRKSGERGATKVRVLRQKVRWTRAKVREVAASAARDANLLADRFRMIDQRDTSTALPSARRAKKPRRASPDNDRVKVALHAANVAGLDGLTRIGVFASA